MENADMAVYFPFSIFNLSSTTVVIDSLKLTFPCDVRFSLASVSQDPMPYFFSRKTTEIIESAH